MNEELFNAINAFVTEKGIDAQYMYDKICEAIVKAAKKALDYNDKEISSTERIRDTIGKQVVVKVKQKVRELDPTLQELYTGILDSQFDPEDKAQEHTVTIELEDGTLKTFNKSDVSIRLPDSIFCVIDPEQKLLRIFKKVTVVDIIDDKATQMTLEQAKNYNENAREGDVIEIDIDPKEATRVFAQNARSVLRQAIREAESESSRREIQEKNQEITTAVVHSVDPDTLDARIEIGRSTIILPRYEQLPTEQLEPGKRIEVFVSVSKNESNMIYANVSRRHPNLVKRLFEREVTEVADGTVEIVSISREAGSRTKIAVASADENVDAIGACIGPRGQRINAVIQALGGEKIDIVGYSEQPEKYIASALSPAAVSRVIIDESNPKCCHAIVPDNQLSLAIGNKGQNVRLAARLTGWKIDIVPQSNEGSIA